MRRPEPNVSQTCSGAYEASDSNETVTDKLECEAERFGSVANTRSSKPTRT